MTFTGLRRSIRTVIGGMLLSTILLIAPTASADTTVDIIAALAQPNQKQAVVTAQGAATQVLHYQGRLLDPTTGQPKTDGAYQMSFSIYDSSTGGAALWSETKSVNVSKGLFTVLLGDSSPLAPAIFNGQDLWLGVSVGADPEMTPRQRLAHVAYAIYAENANNANLVGGQPAGAFAAISHSHLGETWTGQDNPLTINGSFAGPSLLVDNSGAGDGLFVKAVGESGIDVRNNSGYATIYAENSGPANTIYAQNYSQYASIYVNNTGTGNGVGIDSVGGNGIYAGNNSVYAAVYGKNAGAGPGGWFTTYAGGSILVAEEEVTPGAFNVRFSVSRDGDVYADRAFNSNGADFAEMLPAAGGLEPGDVLVIGPQGTLQRSSTPNAATVAGIYSTKPGIVGGWNATEGAAAGAMQGATQGAVQGAAAVGGNPAGNRAPEDGSGDTKATEAVTSQASAETQPSVIAAPKTAQPDPYAVAYAQQGKVPLALVGVVPVKVSAENGAIQPGDLLTTSTTPGHAMKATPVDLGGIPIYRPGTIIGKALTPLTEGTGVITVLVTLQ